MVLVDVRWIYKRMLNDFSGCWMAVFHRCLMVFSGCWIDIKWMLHGLVDVGWIFNGCLMV